MTQIREADLEKIVTTIWGTLFELPLNRVVTGTDGDSTVTSFVHIDGAWHGAVMLQCPMALASLLTSTMFQSGDSPGADDVRDALGEIANMVAGNVKALLPEPCAISLPAVALGSDYQVSVVGATPVATVAFTCLDHSLVVTVLERSVDRGTG